jgi:hypothetical protein
MTTIIPQDMKTTHYKPALLIFIAIFLVSAISAQQVTKEFNKEYKAGAKTTLEISNKYGDVIVQSWDKDQIVIDVKITVELPNREQAEKLLSYIDVEFSEGNNIISATTVIDDKFTFRGWGSPSKRFSIDYNIKMPVMSALALSNRYGNTDINELHGLVKLDIKYGNLNAGKLTRGNIKPLSELNLAYGKGTIDETGWLDVSLRYSGGMIINKSQALLLDSRYSKLTLGETSSVVGETKYDNLRIESINNLVLENGYTDTKIGLLTNKLNYTGSYGSFSIDRIPDNFESINTDTRYMGVNLGIEESANYNLDASIRYGGIRYNESNFNAQKRIVENNSNEVSGIMGKQKSPSANVKITSSYGSVRLN